MKFTHRPEVTDHLDLNDPADHSIKSQISGFAYRIGSYMRHREVFSEASKTYGVSGAGLFFMYVFCPYFSAETDEELGAFTDIVFGTFND